MPKVRPLHQRDWDQLLMVASGYLPLTQGDLKEAMARAIAAHAELIQTIRDEGITTELARGKVTLFVPDTGGIALAFESNRRAQERRAVAQVARVPAPDLGDLALEVFEPNEYIPALEDDEDEPPPDGDWPEVG